VPSPQSSLAARLKVATAAAHQQAERHAFQRSLASGRVPAPRYTMWLSQMFAVHSALEPLLLRVAGARPEFTDEPMPLIPKARLIAADLVALGVRDPAEAVPCVRAFCERLHAWADAAPLRLVGPFYVLEGSTNGGRFLAPRVRAALRLPDSEGTTYLDPYGTSQAEQWTACRFWLDRLTVTADAADAVVAAALETFALTEAIGDVIVREDEAISSR
jgi:heme oxygenase